MESICLESSHLLRIKVSFLILSTLLILDETDLDSFLFKQLYLRSERTVIYFVYIVHEPTMHSLFLEIDKLDEAMSVHFSKRKSDAIACKQPSTNNRNNRYSV